jgi:UDP-N-acetylglucosamine:LPS N-acetylglucosamine transferase
MKICVVCSAGGHLLESFKLLPAIKKYDFFYFTFFVEHLKTTLEKYRTYFTINPRRNPLKYPKVIYDSLKVLLKERPNVIVSTGAGITVPICIIGKILFRTKLIYIDCSAQVYKPSYTGRVLYWFSDLFFVQWKYLKHVYGKKAIYGGLLI